jgi:hypothetical protein
MDRRLDRQKDWYFGYSRRGKAVDAVLDPGIARMRAGGSVALVRTSTAAAHR